MRILQKLLLKAAIASAGGLAALAIVAAPALGFEFSEFSGSLSSGGTFTRQAGTHPDLTTKLLFDETGARTAIVELPAGLTADPTAAPSCPPAGLAAGLYGKFAVCPVGSQVGVANVIGGFPAPIYNMERPAGAPGLLAFNSAGVVIKIAPRVRSTDYGITATAGSISQAVEITGAELNLWGVPADPVHDAERTIQGGNFEYGAPSTAPLLPFITAPTSCPGTPLLTRASADSWWEPGVFKSASYSSDTEGTPMTIVNCGRLRFEPSVSVSPDSRTAGSPVGVSVDLSIPQNEAPYGLATPHLRKTVVTMPEGFRISAAAARGLTSCSLAQIHLGSDEADSCPPAATIGSVKIVTPLLEEELEGDVIVAAQRDNPFGSLLALYIVVEGPGVLLKLPGRVDLDPITGRVTATFAETPQLPFSGLRFALRGGAAAPLVAPDACGTYAAKVELTSWASSEPVRLQAPIRIDEGCGAGGFSPKLQAGTANSKAGAPSPFVLRVTGGDREQNLSRVVATLPEGLLAKLAGVPLCGDVAAVTGACPAASQVGTAIVGTGAGSSPVFIPEAGKAPTAIYLGGPYRGAPYSLVVKVPAQAGPFDLGTVVVRNALRIDPVTTQVTSESDSLPQILEGIPVTYRDLRIEVDRPDFTINPTNCEAKKVAATLSGSGGATATPAVPFAAVDCESLGLAPKLALRFSGAPTRRGGHPKLTATLTPKAGDSNLRRVQVTLPKTEFLDNAHIKTVCTRVQYAADQCPAKSIYGYARAWTPLLDKPLEGPVYLRSSSHTLPDLVASLDGQIHVDLAGRIDSVKKRIRNTFETVPDAPVSKFVLTLQGGGKGLLVNNTQLCKAKPKAKVKFDGQNGKAAETNPLVEVGGCAKAKHRH